jgi:hypothetical protein
MKILQVNVSSEGFRDLQSNADRLQALDAVCAHAASNGCEVVQLPAGFLFAASKQAVNAQAAHFGTAAKKHGVYVIAGVDAFNGSKRRLAKAALVNRGLPFYGFAFDQSGVRLARWRQQCTTSGNGTLQNRVDVAARTITVASGAAAKKLCVLMCGEIFSTPNRDLLAITPSGTFDAVLDIGHSGMGNGLLRAMQNIAKGTRVPVLHCQHLTGSGSIHHIDAQQRAVSVGVNSAQLPGWAQTPWIAVNQVTI